MRILHTMLRVGDLERSIDFYTGVFGMKLLRKSDNPENRYTLAFVGFGDEATGAVLELTYNYGVDKYDLQRVRARRHRGGQRRRDLRRRARTDSKIWRPDHARSGSGEGRQDGDRLHRGSGRVQGRANRDGSRILTRTKPDARGAIARASGYDAVRNSSRRSCAKTSGPCP